MTCSWIVACLLLLSATGSEQANETEGAGDKKAAKFQIIMSLAGDPAQDNEGLRVRLGSDLKLDAGRGIILEGEKLSNAMKGSKNSDKSVLTLYVHQSDKMTVAGLISVLTSMKAKADPTKNTYIFVHVTGE